MKRHYAVLRVDGYYKADDKKDALEYLKNTPKATHVIYTRAQEGNYYHANAQVIAD